MSNHFQLLVSGTIVFLVVLFWLTTPPHTNTWEEAMEMRSICSLRGIQIIGVYAAFAAAVLGHCLRGRSNRSP